MNKTELLDIILKSGERLAKAALKNLPSVSTLAEYHLERKRELDTWKRPRLAYTDSPQLTQREREIVELVINGASNREIARQKGISVGTVKIHLGHAAEKTGLRT